MNLAQRLSAAMIAVVLATTIIAGLITAKNLEPVESQDREYQRLVTERAAVVLDRHVLNTIADVQMASNLIAAQGSANDHDHPAFDSQAVERLLLAIGQANVEYLQVRWIDPDGHEAVRVDCNRESGCASSDHLQDKSKRPYFRAAVDNGGQVHVTGIEPNVEHGRVQRPIVPVLRAARAAVNEMGQLLGVVVINLDMRRVFEQLRDDRAAIYLVHEDGHFILHPNHQRQFSDWTWADEFPGLEGGPGLTPPTTELSRSSGGQRMLVTTARYTSSPGAQVAVVTASPYEASASGALTVSLWWTIAIACLAVVLLSFAISRTITRPLTEMAAMTEALPAGEPVELPVDAAGEVGALARALSRMDAHVREHTARLEQERQRFLAVFEASPVAMITVKPDHTIEMANRAAEELFAYSADQLVGMPVATLVPERSRDTHDARMEGYRAAPSRRSMAEASKLSAVGADGVEIPIQVGLAPLNGNDEKRTLAIITDISAQKAHEAEILRSNEELEQFAYVASHDLQEPLRMVVSFTDLLERRYGDQLDDRARKYIHYASEGAQRMRRLVDDLLQYSRLGTRQQPLRPVDTQAVVAEVMLTLKPAIAEHSATIDIGDLPTVMGEPGRLAQVFQNLFTNCMKYRKPGTPVLISVSATRVGREWQFAVVDNGVGIDMAKADRVFEMFQRLRRTEGEQGSGIGLAVVKRVVEGHGGRIWLNSVIDVGTTVYFTLQPEPED